MVDYLNFNKRNHRFYFLVLFQIFITSFLPNGLPSAFESFPDVLLLRNYKKLLAKDL